MYYLMMIKVEAWAKHLLKQIESYTKIEKASPYIKNISQMNYMNLGRPRNLPW